MQVSFFPKGTDGLVTKVTGELDHHLAQKIRDEADTRILRGRIKKLIFDFSDLRFMDSSGIGLVIGRYKLVKSYGGTVSIVCANMCVNKILHMSGIMRIINVYPSLGEIPENI
ncbi:MAG: anti-sigma factor antagonist [Clostridia bacterium]|nr:anti-sigma factor antagonist [Clostridia bacterium]